MPRTIPMMKWMRTKTKAAWRRRLRQPCRFMLLGIVSRNAMVPSSVAMTIAVPIAEMAAPVRQKYDSVRLEPIWVRNRATVRESLPMAALALLRLLRGVGIIAWNLDLRLEAGGLG